MEVWTRLIVAATQANLGETAKDTKLLHLTENRKAVGYLATWKAKEILLLPIAEGRNRIGRNHRLNYVEDPDCLKGILQGVQWLLEWTPDDVTVVDTDATDGSLLVSHSNRDLLVGPAHKLLDIVPGLYLGWDGKTKHVEVQHLEHGDVLVNPYRCFLYCDRRRLTVS